MLAGIPARLLHIFPRRAVGYGVALASASDSGAKSDVSTSTMYKESIGHVNELGCVVLRYIMPHDVGMA